MEEQVFKSLKWSTLSEISSTVLPPLFYITTARLLTPEDFGLVATSSMIIAFASILWEAGLSKALIQNQEFDIKKMANIMFYTNIFLSVFIYMILFFSSNIIVTMFRDARVSEVIKVSGLSLIIGSLMSVQTALLQREFKFKAIFYNRFIGSIIPGIISVLLAYHGFGYWALVYGSIVSMILQAVLLWKISDWKPSIKYDVEIAKKMFHFSRWVLLSGLLSWFFIWGDIFVLGFFFNSHEIGLYRTGNYFVSSVIGIVTNPVVPVMYSYFSKIQYDKESVKKVLLLSSKVVSFFVLPIGIGLYIVQNPLSDFIFGEKWIGIAPVIGYLALMHSVSWIVGLNNSAYAAVERPDIESKILIVNLFFYLIIYILSAQISFEFFLFARFMLAVISLYVHLFASNKILNVGFLETFGNIKYILSVLIPIFVVSHTFIKNYISSFFLMCLVLWSLVLIYITALYILDKNLLITFTNIIKRRQIYD